MSRPVSDRVYFQVLTLATIYNKVEIGTYDQGVLNDKHFKSEMSPVGILKFYVDDITKGEKIAKFLRQEVASKVNKTKVSELNNISTLKSENVMSIVVLFGD